MNNLNKKKITENLALSILLVIVVVFELYIYEQGKGIRL